MAAVHSAPISELSLLYGTRWLLLHSGVVCCLLRLSELNDDGAWSTLLWHYSWSRGLTPSSGFTKPWYSVIVGILAGGICNLVTKGVWALGGHRIIC